MRFEELTLTGMRATQSVVWTANDELIYKLYTGVQFQYYFLVVILVYQFIVGDYIHS